MKIRTSIILVFLLQITNASAQIFNEEEKSFIPKYFTIVPKSRLTYLNEQMKLGGLSMGEFSTISKDIESLIGLSITKSGAVGIGGISGVAYISNDSMFKHFIDTATLLFDQKTYLLYNKAFCFLTAKDSNEYLIFRAYLKNSPINRIKFMEENFYNIPHTLQAWFRIDLDGIYGVSTESFVGDKLKFKKAKKKWNAIYKKAFDAK
jgi:hypothetical protein